MRSHAKRPGASDGQSFNIPGLTGFRFLSAFFVLVGHGYRVVSFDGQEVIGAWVGPLAACGMTMFFVLSGFLMWLNYGELYRTRPAVENTRDFAIARFARLYPMLLCTLLLPVIFRWHVVEAALPAATSYLLMINAWYPGFSETTLLTFSVPQVAHTWSISAECFCYVLFPLIALVLSRTRSRISILAWGLGAFALLLLAAYEMPRNLEVLKRVLATNVATDQLGMWLTYYSPVTRIFEFGIGCVTAKYFMTDGRPVPYAMWLGAFALAVGIFVFANGPLFASMWSVHDLTIRTSVAAGSALLIYGAATDPDHPLSRAFSGKFVLLGGEISYSTYLLHPFVLGVFNHRSHAESFSIQICDMLATMVVSFAIIYVVSYASYRFVEVPARRRIRGYSARFFARAQLAGA